MKKYFDPEVVMASLRSLTVILEEATETNTTLADEFLKTIRAMKTERRRLFSRQQLWGLEQMKSHLE